MECEIIVCGRFFFFLNFYNIFFLLDDNGKEKRCKELSFEEIYVGYLFLKILLNYLLKFKIKITYIFGAGKCIFF